MSRLPKSIMFLRLLVYSLNTPLLLHTYTLYLIITLFPLFVFFFFFHGSYVRYLPGKNVRVAFVTLSYLKCFASTTCLPVLHYCIFWGCYCPVLLFARSFKGLEGEGVMKDVYPAWQFYALIVSE